MDIPMGHNKPLFTAIAYSARHLFQLLNCINFVSKAHVRITKDGLHFSVEESQVMQGTAFLDQTLFATYTYNANLCHQDEGGREAEDTEIPAFQISLSSLLETLQILGINDGKDRWTSTRDGERYGAFSRPNPTQAFEQRALETNRTCSLSYARLGDPLCITLQEVGVTTTCELVTFEPDYLEEIPLQKDAIAQKIIMKASWLYDAITELSSTSPTRLTIMSSPTAPSFQLSSAGPLGSATFEFSKDPQLLETFQVPARTVNTYKYSQIRAASRAMGLAAKVSIRTDEQGVLSLQFMIEIEDGKFSFVDFRFVPFLPEDGEGEGDE